MDVQGLAYEYEVAEAASESAVTAAVRRTLDVTIAVLALIVLSPVLIAIAIALKLDSRGPVVFRQRRVGRDKEPFTCLKLRTMRADADGERHREYVRQLIDSDAACQEGGKKGLYKLAVDDRVTRVGRFLRKTSLDEVPQLWNVVRGEMSVVGPRPVIAYELELYPSWYQQRFAVKPGITGLWQVNGRNSKTYEEMVKLDIEYVQRRSLILDLKILARTVWVVVSRKGVA